MIENILGIQSMFGNIICGVIIGVGALYMLLSHRTTKFYTKCIKDFNNNKNLPDPIFNNSTLDSINLEFIESVKKGTENINTQVIISKNIADKQKRNESILDYLGSVVIILGLLGTFIGLAGAISQMKDGLNGIENMDKLIADIKEPMKEMATAFYTSIFGMSVSIFISILERISMFSYVHNKQVFFDSIEDYLDNTVYTKYSSNSNQLIVDFTNKVETSMKYMTDKVTETFAEGVDKFADRINYVSVDLRESAGTLNGVIDKLERSVNSFSTPVFAFKESIEKFKAIYDGLDFKLENAKDIVRDLSDSFEATIESFNENRDKMHEVTDILNESMGTLIDSYNQVKVLTSNFEKASNRNDGIIVRSQSQIEEVYRELNIVMGQLNQQLTDMSDKVANSLKLSFENEAAVISRSIKDEVSMTMSEFKSRNEYFENALDKFGKRIDTFQSMIEETMIQEHIREAVNIEN